MYARRPTALGSLFAFALIVVPAVPALAANASDTAALEQGREIAARNCAGCHAIDRTGASPFAGAPPFRTLGQSYPVSHLQEALAEGIVTGHPDMPQVAWDPATIEVFLAYLESIQVPASQ